MRKGRLIAFAAVCGAAAGWSAARGLAVERADDAPPGWRKDIRNAAYMSEATLGELEAAPGAWSLAAYANLRADAPADALPVTVELGASGELWIFPAAEGHREPEGLALHLATGQVPRAERVTASGGAPVPCAGSLPTPGAEPYSVVARADGSFVAGGETLRCQPLPGRGPGVSTGLHRVRLHDLGTPRPRDLVPVAAIVAGGATAAAVVAAPELLVLPGWVVALTTAPLLAGLLLAPLHLAGLHEAMRIPTLRVQLVPAIVAVALTTILKVAVHAARPLPFPLAIGSALAAFAAIVPHDDWRWIPAAAGTAGGALAGAALLLRLPRALPGAMLPAATAGALAVVAGLSAPVGRIWMVLAGAALGVVIQLNVHRARFYNLLSLATALFGLLAVEMVLRNSSVSNYWDATNAVQGAGDVATLVSQLEALHRSEHEAWPASGYPVEAPPKSDRPRVVCLGGSSTAGAWQNASLDEFYPAMLESRLGVEVVNQGAGGWNSLHIGLYATSNLARLDPDVVTVYTGVNEVVEVPVTYRELLAAWKAGELRTTAGVLGSVRLFQGLRSIVRSVRSSVVAVPPEHTAENLATVVTAARGAKVLLLSEGVQPRPEGLDAYWKVMRALDAEHDDVAFLHTAEGLRSLGQRAFLDENHLSAAGHAKVAEMVAGELRRLGWVR